MRRTMSTIAQNGLSIDDGLNTNQIESLEYVIAKEYPIADFAQFVLEYYDE